MNDSKSIATALLSLPPAIAPEMLTAAFVHAHDAVLLVEATISEGEPCWVVQWANPATVELLGYPTDTLVGRSVEQFAAPGREGEMVHLFELGAKTAVDTELSDRAGVTAHFHLQSAPLGMWGGRRYWSLTMRERTEAAETAQRLQASEARFQALAEQAPIGIFRSDVGLRLGYANARCAEILGIPLKQLLGFGWLATFCETDRSRVTSALEQVLCGTEIELHQLRVFGPNDTTRWVDMRVAPVNTSTTGFIGSLEDVTERRLLESALAHDATHDRLTGLPNRSLLWSQLEDALNAGEGVAVMFVDLDNFKLVNDSLGHEAGDQLLVAVAQLLASALRPNDLVARFGGDEFVVVCPRVKSQELGEMIAGRLVDSLADAIDVGSRSLTVTASVGLVVATTPGRDPESVLRDADIALYQAKAAGKHRWEAFDEQARHDATSRLHMAGDLRRAIDDGSLDVHFQPIMDLETGQFSAVEALARWDRPGTGPVPPSIFIGLAEELGLIDALGEHVLRRACTELAAWRATTDGNTPSFVSVNLSVRQLNNPAVVDMIRGALTSAELDGADLCLEITESVLITDPERVLEVLLQLKALGVRMAIDDFGTGYSSLAYLQRFPGDYLKVDRSFVQRLTDDATSAASVAIVTAVIRMAEAIGLTVVAEGVETLSELAEVRRLGCTCAQGFYLGRPMPAALVPLAMTGTGPGEQTSDRAV